MDWENFCLIKKMDRSRGNLKDALESERVVTMFNPFSGPGELKYVFFFLKKKNCSALKLKINPTSFGGVSKKCWFLPPNFPKILRAVVPWG